MELDNPDGKPGASPDPTQQPEDDKGESSRGVDPVEIQVRFFTKDSEVSVPGNAFSVPLRLGPKGLSEIVNALAEERGCKSELVFPVGWEWLGMHID
eukprot:480374-Amorphochlora_amoeboformis.AAC.1